MQQTYRMLQRIGYRNASGSDPVGTFRNGTPEQEFYEG